MHVEAGLLPARGGAEEANDREPIDPAARERRASRIQLGLRRNRLEVHIHQPQREVSHPAPTVSRVSSIAHCWKC